MRFWRRAFFNSLRSLNVKFRLQWAGGCVRHRDRLLAWVDGADGHRLGSASTVAWLSESHRNHLGPSRDGRAPPTRQRASAVPPGCRCSSRRTPTGSRAAPTRGRHRPGLRASGSRIVSHLFHPPAVRETLEQATVVARLRGLTAARRRSMLVAALRPTGHRWRVPAGTAPPSSPGRTRGCRQPARHGWTAVRCRSRMRLRNSMCPGSGPLRSLPSFLLRLAFVVARSPAKLVHRRRSNRRAVFAGQVFRQAPSAPVRGYALTRPIGSKPSIPPPGSLCSRCAGDGEAPASGDSTPGGGVFGVKASEITFSMGLPFCLPPQ